jgi:hypothetical protein
VTIQLHKNNLHQLEVGSNVTHSEHAEPSHSRLRLEGADKCNESCDDEKLKHVS